MGFRCFVCKLIFSTVKELVRHLKFKHAFYPGKKFLLTCDQSGCHQKFLTYSGFRKHLYIKHGNDNPDDNHDEPIPPSVDFSNQQSVSSSCPAENPECSTNATSNRQNTQEMCASLIAKLRSSGMPTKVVTSVVENLEELVHELHSNIRDDVANLVPDDENIQAKFENYFESLENPFTHLNTETKWKKYFHDKCRMVEPVEIPLGVRYDIRRNRASGTYDQVLVTDKCVYVPLLETLKFIFSNQEISNYMVQPCEDSGVYKDFCDGTYFKDHPLFSQKGSSLQIQLFYDEFETANPLGSKHGIHKIGSIYFILRNFTPKINSALMNIHLISLFHSEDVKKYGFNAILEPLMCDLKILEAKGINVPFSNEPLYGTVAQVTGDNLGLHTFLGYVESFSASYFCRFCLADKELCQTVFSDDDTNITLRCKELHVQHCKDVEEDPSLSSSFGVKHTCLLDDLKYFSVSDNFAVDIMHDVLEGVAQLEIKLLLGYFLENNILSQQDISNRIYSYNVGYLDRKNRPTRINLEQSGNGIGLNAIQTFCLIRNMPLIFGDVVGEGDSHWQLLLLLLQIINIIFSPKITDGMTICLKHLIVEHHRLFKMLYPNRRLIPKHHFMIHYPRAIRKIGPILHFWAMRFEAKHRFFKNTVKNFKNITKSLAQTHQMAIAFHWESLPFKSINCGPVKSVSLDNFINGEIIANSLCVTIDSEVDLTSWITYFGTEYRAGLMVCSKLEEGMPTFSQIKEIIGLDEEYFLVTEDFETLGFAEHFHSYHVLQSDKGNVSLLKVDQLCFFKPFDLQTTYGFDSDDHYIVPVQVFL